MLGIPEALISLNAVRDCFPKSVSHNTVIRWTDEGLLGVKLKCYRIGDRRFTTREECDRFIESVDSRKAQLDATNAAVEELVAKPFTDPKVKALKLISAASDVKAS